MLIQRSLNRAAVALVGAAILWCPVAAHAQDEGGTKAARELRAEYDKAVKGKTVALCADYARRADLRGMGPHDRDPRPRGAA